MNSRLMLAALLFLASASACSAEAGPASPALPTENPIQPETPPTEVFPPTAAPGITPTQAGQETPAAVGVSYSTQVAPILEASCTKCHGVDQVKEGLDLTTYAGLMRGSFNGPVIAPGSSADSYLVQLVVEGKMPNRGPKLTAEQVGILSNWIDQGALDN